VTQYRERGSKRKTGGFDAGNKEDTRERGRVNRSEEEQLRNSARSKGGSQDE